MKKAYGKPMLFAESFELVEHIAGDCRVNDNFEGAKFHNSGECRYEDGNISLFLSADHLCDSYLFNNAGLEISIPNVPYLGMKCYNAFLDVGNHLFSS